MSDLNQKQAIFRSVSATVYLCNALRCTLFALQGFPSPNLFFLLFGGALTGLNLAMVCVNTGKPPAVLASLESVRFPAIPWVMPAGGESFFTYRGRLAVDGIVAFCLWLVMGSHFLAFLTAALFAAAAAFRTMQPDLHTELFRGSGDAAGGAGGGGNYQTVDNLV